MQAGHRYLIDGSMARNGGGFTYLVNLLPRLCEQAPEDRFLVFLGHAGLARALPALPNLEIVLRPQEGLRDRLRFTWRELPRWAEQWNADLLFSAGECAPLRAPCPTVASFRNANLFAWRDHAWPAHQKLRLGSLHALARLSAARCARILFVSEDSARWIGDAIGLPRERRSVVHHGVDPDVWRPTAERPRPGYILSVSSIYRYKNFVPLIEAYGKLARRRPDLPELVIVGDDQDPAYRARMEAARRATGDAADAIHIRGEVPYSEVRRYYAEAALSVFPSDFETFGHPLLEAMAAEVPLVASDIPVFREIADDAAFYADPRDPEALARAMEEVLYTSGAAEALVKRGRERVRRFTWDRTARRLLALFASVVRDHTARLPEPAPVFAPAAPQPAALSAAAFLGREPAAGA